MNLSILVNHPTMNPLRRRSILHRTDMELIATILGANSSTSKSTSIYDVLTYPVPCHQGELKGLEPIWIEVGVEWGMEEVVVVRRMTAVKCQREERKGGSRQKAAGGGTEVVRELGTISYGSWTTRPKLVSGVCCYLEFKPFIS